MLKSFVLTTLLALMAVISASATYQIEDASLRGSPKNRYEQDEERATVFICNMVEGLFEGEVDCTCKNRWLFGEVGFSCETKEADCSDLPATGTYCAKTKFDGSISWFALQLKTNVAMTACRTGGWANNTIAGDVLVGDVCFGLGVTGRVLGPSGISKCSAKFGAGDDLIECKTCSSCKYDVPKTNRTGVQLSCTNLAVSPCFPYEVPIFVKGREDEEMDPQEMLSNFRPQEVTSGPALQFALYTVEEAVAAMDLY